MDTQGRTYYQLLGVERDASAEEIKLAYREIARIFHPDSNHYADLTDIGLTDNDNFVFKEITAAYAILSDPQTRREYDETLPAEFRDWDADDEPDWKTPDQYIRWHAKQERARQSNFGQLPTEPAEPSIPEQTIEGLVEGRDQNVVSSNSRTLSQLVLEEESHAVKRTLYIVCAAFASVLVLIGIAISLL